MNEKATPLLTFEETSHLLDCIVSNKRIEKIAVGNKKIFVAFSYPTVEETLLIRYKKQETYELALEEGLPTIAELEVRLGATNMFSSEDKEALKKLEEQIVGQKRLLQITRIEGRRTPIKDNIARMEKEILEIRKRRENFNYHSAENKAEEIVLFFTCWLCTYKPEGRRFWNGFEDFEKEEDLHTRNQILLSFLEFNRGMPLKTVRYLARSNLWRTRFTSATKMGGRLFSRELYDLTPDQLGLLYWSNFYQSIYEMLPSDRPSDEIIADDDALDAYMEHYFKQRDAERNESRVRRGGFGSKGKLSAWEKGEELIITPNHSSYFDIQYTDKKVSAEANTTDVATASRGSKRSRGKFSSLSRR